jgi:hypothetical protein
MTSRKTFASISVALIASALVYGCSSSTDNGTPAADAGGTPDTGTKPDTGTGDAKADTAPDGNDLVCAPKSVTNFMPPAFSPVHQQAGACTTQNIADFDTNCLATGHTKAMCDAFKMANATCAGCLEGKTTDSMWGASVFHASSAPGSTLGVIQVNIGGCFEVLGGSAGVDCSKKLQAADACENAACDSVCQITDDASFQLYQACINQAAQGDCMTQAAAASTCEQTLGMAAGTSACVNGSDFQTLFDAVAPIICGTPTATDGGTDAPADAPNEGG